MKITKAAMLQMVRDEWEEISSDPENEFTEAGYLRFRLEQFTSESGWDGDGPTWRRIAGLCLKELE